MYLFIESQYLESYQFGNHISLTKTVFIKLQLQLGLRSRYSSVVTQNMI